MPVPDLALPAKRYTLTSPQVWSNTVSTPAIQWNQNATPAIYTSASSLLDTK